MEAKLLQHIDSPCDLRKLEERQLPQLAGELRDFILDVVAAKAGHLGASLGVVELTIALHYCFNTPDDQLVWDVGHQAYGHKILTGRRDNFHTNRQLGGISGFPKREESLYDTFGVGHSSTGISAALGMAIGSKLAGNLSREHIVVIGDASIASGMAFEGLNHAGVTDANLLVILNDNAIGIDPSVGALKEYLLKATLNNTPEQDNIFEALNFTYKGPIDGHDFKALINAFKELKGVQGPKLLHVITKKGKGLAQAEADQVTYHAPGKFDRKTGELLPKSAEKLPPKFQDVFGHTLVELAKEDPKIIGITPAMPTGSSLKYMMEAFPERAFDVGIAEQHAVTFAAGLATQGYKVFCNIYSTFLQRAYDQVIHDVCLQKLPVIFCLDRAGIVGEDGPTHHGIFDLAYLRCIPNIMIYAPANEADLRNIMYTATQGLKNPIAIRYPRGRGQVIDWRSPVKKIHLGLGKTIQSGSKVAVLSLGTVLTDVLKATKQLKHQVSIYDLQFLAPLDHHMLDMVFENYETVITVEDGVVAGGFGSAVTEYAAFKNAKITIESLGVQGVFPDHGSIPELKAASGYDSDSIKAVIENYL